MGGAVGRLTFSVLWAQYLDRAVRGKKKSDSEIERIGRKFILPRFGDRLADTITRSEVTALVEDITYRDPHHPTPRAGLGVHQQLSSFFTWAMPKLEQLPANPCRDAGRPPLPKACDRFLSDAEIRVFWQACDAMWWPFGPGFKLLLLPASVAVRCSTHLDPSSMAIPGLSRLLEQRMVKLTSSLSQKLLAR